MCAAAPLAVPGDYLRGALDDNLDAAGVRAPVARSDASIQEKIEVGDVDGVRACGKVFRVPARATERAGALDVHKQRPVDGESRAVVGPGAEGVVACLADLEGAGEGGCKVEVLRARHQGQPVLIFQTVWDIDAVDVGNADWHERGYVGQLEDQNIRIKVVHAQDKACAFRRVAGPRGTVGVGRAGHLLV